MRARSFRNAAFMVFCVAWVTMGRNANVIAKLDCTSAPVSGVACTGPFTRSEDAVEDCAAQDCNYACFEQAQQNWWCSEYAFSTGDGAYGCSVTMLFGGEMCAIAEGSCDCTCSEGICDPF